MKDEAFWVFGYGSLMWNPGFPHQERQIARLEGWHRCFCMRSIHHRGTPEVPGLVLALDAAPGALCEGVAFSVTAADAGPTLAALRERELVSAAYLETTQPVVLRDGRRVAALTYVVDPHHVQYCGGLALEEQARIIFRAVGGRGPNTEYLFNTLAQLAELDIADADMAWLGARVREIARSCPGGAEVLS